MKKHVSTGLLAASLLATVMAGPAKADIKTIKDSNNLLWISGGSTFLNYKEPSQGAFLPDSERGWIPSGAIGGSTMLYQNFYLALESSLVQGHADYNGALLATPTIPYQSSTRETISETDGKFGRSFALGNLLVTPYAELGYRYWRRNLGGGQIEDYRNSEVLGGAMVQAEPIQHIILTAFAAGGSTFGTRMKAGSDKFDLGNSGVYKVGGKIAYSLTPGIELFTTADYRHFHYEQSPVAPSGYYEPDSNTGETALRAGIGFHFR